MNRISAIDIDKRMEDEKNTDMAAKEASHLRKEVPKPRRPSLEVWLMRFLAAIFKSLRSELINWLGSGSVFMARYSILPIFVSDLTFSRVSSKQVVCAERSRSEKEHSGFSGSLYIMHGAVSFQPWRMVGPSFHLNRWVNSGIRPFHFIHQRAPRGLL